MSFFAAQSALYTHGKRGSFTHVIWTFRGKSFDTCVAIDTSYTCRNIHLASNGARPMQLSLSLISRPLENMKRPYLRLVGLV
jgi:hypothetical protein